MACQGGECKVQIFDVRVNKVTVKEMWVDVFGTKIKNPVPDKYKNPTQSQIEELLRKKPIWLSQCPNPGKQPIPPCECLFTKEYLDPEKHWTQWRTRKAPSEAVEIRFAGVNSLKKLLANTS